MNNRFKSLAAAMAVAVGLSAAEAPKYIFYFIGDGMGMAQSLAAQVYNRTVRGADEPILMMQFPVSSASTTHSWSSPVTDSAAAGTALATGTKTRNGMLGMAADTTSVTSVAKELFDRGYGVALVTSVPPDDATPGAFYAHVPSRKMYYEIGRQAAESGYDFIAGSNLRGLTDKDGNPTDLLDQFKANNVTVAHGLAEAAAAGPGRVLLLNPAEIDYHQIHFTIDSVPGAMNLPDMTAAALEQLRLNGRDRFFMMVEGGNIDYGGHANDGGTIIKEVLNFNQALRHAYDWYLAHPDETLILVTADHETGGMGLGNNTVGYDLHLGYIDSQRISKDAFAEYWRAMANSRRIIRWEDMKEFLTDNLGFWKTVPVTPAQEEKLIADFDICLNHRNAASDNKTLYNSFNTFTEDVFHIMDSVTGLGWTTNGHSGGLVPVYAIGVGSELFAPLNDNIDLPAKLRKIVN
ncbi:MAG: alkaline phosphatase [Duncaniella sp.]|nr:alkaline phosphatase [Duncaniella sp.]